MFFKILLSTLAVTMALGACEPAMTKPDEPTLAPPMRGRCDATKVQSFVGKAASADVQEQARAASGAGSVRTLQPGQPITKEFNGERLNLHVDAANRVVRINCG